MSAGKDPNIERLVKRIDSTQAVKIMGVITPINAIPFFPPHY
jgi:hypothetical protein